jgi:alkanesulfonate monooxygenase SsuD/methylene tetrahydromethanopterin reductase-like flavin-dependent oxidoreductase (luciferase family)
MDFGAAMFFTEYSMTPGALARALEARGFESLWAPEHSHIPTSRRTPFPAKSEAEYHGELVDFPPMMAWPKPVQKPHPPVIVGGAFPHAARRAVTYGDGWIPHASRPQYGDVTEFLPRFRQMATEAGRDPGVVPVTVWGVPEDPDRLRRHRDIGIARVVVSLDSAPADEILPALDRWAGLISCTQQ